MTLHFRAFRAFGDDVYAGPGSPGYQYATPDQVSAANVGETYVQPAVNPYEYVTSVPQYLPAAQPQQDTSASSSGGASDFFSSLVGGLFNKPAQQQRYAPPSSSMPSWVIPAAIGGVALVLGAVLISSRRPSLAGRRNRRRSKR